VKNLRVLILDFDGVVIESNAVKTEAFEYVFARFPEYAEAMMAFHHAHVSIDRFVKFRRLAELMGKEKDAGFLTEIAESFSAQVRSAMLKVPLVPGADSFLDKAVANMPVYLASVTPERELFDVLNKRNLAHWFLEVYGCPPWTKPEAIRDILSREKIGPSGALLIGDSAGDQRAARETGINFLGRDSGLEFDSPLPLCFSDMKEIEKYLGDFIK